MKKLLLLCSMLAASLFAVTACTDAQLLASGTYIAAEVATTQLITKNPSLLPTAQLLVADWSKFQLGKLTATDEAGLLNNIVAATKSKLSPTQAALLDGAVQQLLANQNASAPTPLTGASAAIVTDVMNGVARAIVVYQTPAATSIGS